MFFFDAVQNINGYEKFYAELSALFSTNSIQLKGGQMSYFHPHNIAKFVIAISDVENLQLCHSIVGNQPSILAFSIYADEYEKLLNMVPGSLESEFGVTPTFKSDKWFRVTKL